MRKIHRWIAMGLVRLPGASKKTEAKKTEGRSENLKNLSGLERERERVESEVILTEGRSFRTGE
jgi:hypothetical protein